MTTATTAAEFEAALRPLATEEQRAAYGRYFPGDASFLGVRMRDVFALSASSVSMPVAELEALLESPAHEARVGACSIMGKSATARAVPRERNQELYELYLRRHDRIDAWDLVDLAAHQVVGSWLQKAVGWMLRIVGDIDEAVLLAHLDRHAASMSRVAVRASLEKVDATTRARYR
ncbi:MAG TPA: DNA alkylation repair protein [Naasia sp.]|jgi:3-methyladenine DNA glycosylase AlkD